MSNPFTYEFRFKDREPLDCESCSYPAPLTDLPINPDRSRTAQLCALCVNTWAWRAVEYPTHYAESGPVMQTVCYVGNAILAEIRRAIPGVPLQSEESADSATEAIAYLRAHLGCGGAVVAWKSKDSGATYALCSRCLEECCW